MSKENNCILENEQELIEVFFNSLTKGEIEDNTIVWVKTITDPCIVGASLILVVEDKNSQVLPLVLNNHVSEDTKFERLKKDYPVDLEFAIR